MDIGAQEDGAKGSVVETSTVCVHADKRNQAGTGSLHSRLMGTEQWSRSSSDSQAQVPMKSR